MRYRRQILMCMLMISYCLISGCGVTLGPTVETNYVLVHPGQPMILLQSVTARGRPLNDQKGAVMEQDIGGWICMPADHWAVVLKALEAAQIKPVSPEAKDVK